MVSLHSPMRQMRFEKVVICPGSMRTPIDADFSLISGSFFKYSFVCFFPEFSQAFQADSPASGVSVNSKRKSLKIKSPAVFRRSQHAGRCQVSQRDLSE